MQLQQAVNNVFVQLADTLQQLSHEEYIKPCNTLFNNTIGQHVRHIIELFQCLENGYDTDKVNYEKRPRDIAIETDKEFAGRLLQDIFKKLARPDKELVLEACYEHTIHHMALIRVGITEVSGIQLSDDFGVASSTVKYRKQCAQ